MQNQESNYVYVVSLNRDVFFEDVGLSFVDVIEKHNKYFHPMENWGLTEPHWELTKPPNYIAFRYDGKLQSIHHIKSYKVIEGFQEDFDLPSARDAGGQHYLYELGPAIRPIKEVRTVDKAGGYKGIRRDDHCWCFIDLLLTCDSISEASVKTRERAGKTECYVS